MTDTMSKGRKVLIPYRRNYRQPIFLFLSTVAIVSLPTVYSWSTSTSFVLRSPLALSTSPISGCDRRFLIIKESRKYPVLQGFIHLRAQEEAKSTNDVSVLNERLWSAAELGDEQTIRTLISVGAEVNSQPTLTTPESEDQQPLLQEPVLGPSALHLAAGNGKSKAVCALVELGADVTTRDAELCTPLHCAVVGGHLDTVQVLVTLGADLKSRDRRGRTPLAAGRESPQCGEELLTLLRALTAGGEDPPPPPASS